MRAQSQASHRRQHERKADRPDAMRRRKKIMFQSNGDRQANEERTENPDALAARNENQWLLAYGR
jgi:hypothetical protein